MSVEFNSIFDRETKFYFVKQVLKHGINNKMSPKYILEFRKNEIAFIASLFWSVGL